MNEFINLKINKYETAKLQCTQVVLKFMQSKKFSHYTNLHELHKFCNFF